MEISIDYAGITRLMTIAHGEGRNSLYEYEMYSLLSKSGAETPPKFAPLASVLHYLGNSFMNANRCEGVAFEKGWLYDNPL